MNIFSKTLIGLIALAAFAFGQQNNFTTTTTTAAISADDAGNSAHVVFLTSTTGITAPSLPTSIGGIGDPSGAALTLLMIDEEIMRVNSLGAASGSVQVERGYFGTLSHAHASGAKVWAGAANWFTENEPDANGACVASQQVVLPRIVATEGPTRARKPRAWTCANNVWGTFDGYATAEGATIASATTIAPTQALATVSGTTAIVNVTVPAACQAAALSVCQVHLIPTGVWTTTAAGNILHASTSIVGIDMVLTYQPSVAKWATSY